MKKYKTILVVIAMIGLWMALVLADDMEATKREMTAAVILILMAAANLFTVFNINHLISNKK